LKENSKATPYKTNTKLKATGSLLKPNVQTLKPKKPIVVNRSSSTSRTPTAANSLKSSKSFTSIKQCKSEQDFEDAQKREHKSRGEINKNVLQYLLKKLNLNSLLNETCDEVSDEIDTKNYEMIISQIDKSFVSKQANDMDSKLESMKHEIDDLKKQLNNTLASSSNLSLNRSLPKPHEDSLYSNLIRELNELKIKNKALATENETLRKMSTRSMSVGDLTSMRPPNRDVPMGAQSNERCKVLEYLLDQKNKQIDEYVGLFKEIGTNVSCLINELESSKKKENANESVRILKQKLSHFNSKCINFNPAAHNFFDRTTGSNTSSDTLVDADSSFNSLVNLDLLKNQPFHPQAFLIDNNQGDANAQSTYSSLKSSFFDNGNTRPLLKVTTFQDNDDYDVENIVVPLEDISITTLQTTDTTNNTISTLKSTDDEHFREGLKELDQKIFRVKKLLDSMKTT